MAAPTNASCPICGMDADPANSSKFKGQMIAFCSQECMADWSDMPDNEKQERIDESTFGEEAA